MSAPLTFGDTFTLPSTGDEQWLIVDRRPTSYTPPENLDLPGRRLADAVSDNYYAIYTSGRWRVLEGPEKERAEADLNALTYSLGHRTDDVWRARHITQYQNETRYRIEQVVGTSDVAQIVHPLVPNEETIATIAATAAVTAAKRPLDDPLYQSVYDATLEALRA